MPSKIYRLRLTDHEREDLKSLANLGRASARKQTHARILLQCDEGVEAALNRKPQRNRRPKRLDGEAEARLVATACGEPPAGRARWTLRLLADRLVELEVVESVSIETVRRTPRKTISSRG